MNHLVQAIQTNEQLIWFDPTRIVSLTPHRDRDGVSVMRLANDRHTYYLKEELQELVERIQEGD